MIELNITLILFIYRKNYNLLIVQSQVIIGKSRTNLTNSIRYWYQPNCRLQEISTPATRSLDHLGIIT